MSGWWLVAGGAVVLAAIAALLVARAVARAVEGVLEPSAELVGIGDEAAGLGRALWTALDRLEEGRAPPGAAPSPNTTPR